MNAVKSMLLDLRGTKAQLKNGWVLLLFLPLLIFIGMATKLATAALIIFYMMLFIISVIMPLWAFSAFDNFSTMYLAFPQKRVDIVRGRYLLFLISGAISLLVCTLVTLFTGVLGFNISGMAVIICAFAFGFALLPSIQAPVFFQFGYAKSRTFFLISLFGLWSLAWLAMKRFSNDQMDAFMNGKAIIVNEPLICIEFLLSALFFLAISYLISAALFTKKDR